MFFTFTCYISYSVVCLSLVCLHLSIVSLFKNLYFFQPRLGPKPFTPPKLNFGISSASLESEPSAVTQNFEDSLAQRNSPEGAPDSSSCWYSNGSSEHTNGSEKNGKADAHSFNDDSNGSPPLSGSSSPEKPKTPSTSERRRVFETKVPSVDSQQILIASHLLLMVCYWMR